MVEKKFFDENNLEGYRELMYRMERDAKGKKGLHITGEEWEMILPQGKLFKFTFVRHPLSRLVSAYINKFVDMKVLMIFKQTHQSVRVVTVKKYQKTTGTDSNTTEGLQN